MKNSRLYFFASLLLLVFAGMSYAAENPILKSVPDNTLFFSGNTQLMNLDDIPLMSVSQLFNKPAAQSGQHHLSEELAFFYELYLDFAATMKNNNNQDGSSLLRTRYGLAKDFAFSFYSVGIMPVIKMTLDNEQPLWNVLQQAEEKSGLQHKKERFEGVQLRTYTLTEQHQLIVSLQTMAGGKKLVTLAIWSDGIDVRQKKLILGLSQPEHSVLTRVLALQKENHYLPLSISFLDFQQLTRSLFQAKDNPWVALLSDQDKLFTQISESACEADMNNIARDMPRIIAGYKQYQVQGQKLTMAFEALLELKNKGLKTELQQLRGYIPGYIRHGAQDNIISFALGANLSQLSPFFVYLSQTIRESKFHCQALKDLQKSAAEFNPMMLAMVTGIADGIQGIGFALQDFQLTDNKGKPDVLDISLLMTLSADEPLKVWQMLAALNPQELSLTPSEKPQRLTIAELDDSDLELFIALKGKHIVLYSGKKAQQVSESLSDEPLSRNGFFQESLNYSRLSDAMNDLRTVMMSSDNQPAAVPAESCVIFDETIGLINQLSGFIDIHSDFVEQGWLNSVNADIHFNPQRQKSYKLPGKYEIYYVENGCQLVKDGREEILADGTGFYQQYSADGQCVAYETRYRWQQSGEQVSLQYLSERTRTDGSCKHEFGQWMIPEVQYINDVCQLRTEPDGNFSCVYNWDGVLNKAVFKKI